ncbi:hypothetical protein CHUAL_005565 [Chamberlinius hualienensis]
MASAECSNVDDPVKSEQEPFDHHLECPVCLQNCVHPVRLPCGHIFCFLCIKGATNLSKRCALCRKELPVDYLDNPDLVELSKTLCDIAFEDGQQWYYEGHQGWWQYDVRTSAELEAAFKRHEKKCDVLVAGFIYTIDFDAMIQYRRDDPSKRRRIKRDLITIAKKGIAGIRLAEPQTLDNSINEPVDHQIEQSSIQLNSPESSVEELSSILDNFTLNSPNVSDSDEYL